MRRLLWSFTEQVPQVRVKRLMSHTSFEAVQARVAAARVTAFVWEPYRGPELRGCHRASFLLDVSASTYDAFFNSPVGLRAQYALTPAHGEAANRRLLTVLAGKLLRRGLQAEAPGIEMLLWSLGASQAKIWIYEDEVQLQMGTSEPAIDYVRWAARSESGIGVLAPVGRQLQVMGGWLDQAGVVTSNPKKESRSLEIHRTGFS